MMACGFTMLRQFPASASGTKLTFSPVEAVCLRRSSLASNAQPTLNAAESDTDVKQHSAPGVAGYRHILKNQLR